MGWKTVRKRPPVQIRRIRARSRRGRTPLAIGRLAVDSISGRDYPVVQAIVLVSALSFMASTLLVDLLYAWLDPRISYAGARR